MDLNALMQQAQKMQQDMEKQDKELKSKKYHASVGGGVVEVTLSGNFQLEDIKIEEELLETDNKEMLQDLITTAINTVLSEATKEKEDGMASLASGINLPGGF